MSNQRAGNWKPASMTGGDRSSMQLCMFVKTCKEVLENRGEDDAAFYFEQIEDWLRKGKQLQSGHNDVKQILGL
jgi:hypothetical protein